MSLSARLWALNILSIGVVLLCGRLSYWQYERGHEKDLLLEQQTNFEKRVYDLDHIDIDDVTHQQFRRVKLRGHFLNEHQLYLDNQIHEHRFGYDILTPFQTLSGRSIWVNRGWLLGIQDRRKLPKVIPIEQEVQIVGMLAKLKEKRFHLGKIRDSGMPNRIQTIDPRVLQESYPSTVKKLVLILEDHQPGILTNHYKIVVVPPARHRGYAVQWLCIAIAWLGLILYANKKALNSAL